MPRQTKGLVITVRVSDHEQIELIERAIKEAGLVHYSDAARIALLAWARQQLKE